MRNFIKLARFGIEIRWAWNELENLKKSSKSFFFFLTLGFVFFPFCSRWKYFVFSLFAFSKAFWFEKTIPAPVSLEIEKKLKFLLPFMFFQVSKLHYHFEKNSSDCSRFNQTSKEISCPCSIFYCKRKVIKTLTAS